MIAALCKGSVIKCSLNSRVFVHSRIYLVDFLSFLQARQLL